MVTLWSEKVISSCVSPVILSDIEVRVDREKMNIAPHRYLAVARADGASQAVLGKPWRVRRCCDDRR